MIAINHKALCSTVVPMVLGLALIVQAVSALASTPVDRLLDGWLREAGLAGATLSVDVRPVEGPAPLLRRNAAQARNPASTIKLLTTATALHVLGPDYRWETRFFLDGPLVDGRLTGNLRLVGGGDPKFVIEDLTEMVVQMQAAGLRHITGDLVLDRSLYRPGLLTGPFDGLAAEPYNVEPDAALMNFKSTKFIVTPRAGSALISLDPPLAELTLDNQVQLVSGPCRYGAGGLSVTDSKRSGRPVITVRGRYSTRCGEGTAFHAVLDHTQFADAFFRAAWLSAGGTWSGRARTLDDEAAAAIATMSSPASQQPWFVWRSPRTLADVVTDINKFSNNVMTRQLLLHLGALRRESATDRTAASGSRAVPDEAAGGRVVARWLDSAGIDAASLVLDNGAGLSREARASATLLVDVLVHEALGASAATMRESLPVVGVDGTMRHRLRGSGLEGRAWIKTGSIAGVRSIAGYVRARSGRLVALALIVNDARASASVAVQDQLLRWVFENG